MNPALSKRVDVCLRPHPRLSRGLYASRPGWLGSKSTWLLVFRRYRVCVLLKQTGEEKSQYYDHIIHSKIEIRPRRRWGGGGDTHCSPEINRKGGGERGSQECDHIKELLITVLWRNIPSSVCEHLLATLWYPTASHEKTVHFPFHIGYSHHRSSLTETQTCLHPS